MVSSRFKDHLSILQWRIAGCVINGTPLRACGLRYCFSVTIAAAFPFEKVTMTICVVWRILERNRKMVTLCPSNMEEKKNS